MLWAASAAAETLLAVVLVTSLGGIGVGMAHPLFRTGFALMPPAAYAAAWLGGHEAGATLGALALASSLTALALFVSHQQQAARQWRRWMSDRARISHLGRKLADAQHGVADRSRMLAFASHELRQPAQALGLFAGALTQRLREPGDQTLITHLCSTAQSLERSCNALLDVTRLESGAVGVDVETFSLRDLFFQLQNQYAHQAESKGVGLRLAPGGKRVTSDPSLLLTLLSNLIHNALKHTARGGVVVVARQRGERIQIDVCDTGPGIAASEMPSMFDEFRQLTHHAPGGSGLGLAIVKRLAQLLGHRLEVHSQLGRGTTFRLLLPRGAPLGLREPLAGRTPSPVLVQMNPPRTVLIVEGDDEVREGLRAVFRHWGYDTLVASTALQAEQRAVSVMGRIDLLLCELRLNEGADGNSLAWRLRALCARHMPVVLLGSSPAEVAASKEQALLKPVNVARLFQAVGAAWGDRLEG